MGLMSHLIQELMCATTTLTNYRRTRSEELSLCGSQLIAKKTVRYVGVYGRAVQL